MSGVRGRGVLRRKDFDPKVGLAVVIAGATISGIFYWFGRDLIAYSILAAAALIDLIVYGRLKDITVCYRCHAEFRGAFSPPPSLSISTSRTSSSRSTNEGSDGGRDANAEC